jgi:glycosyltransferase involved in cell wall biosynthesis
MTRRTLVVVRNLPSPPRGGGDLRTLAIVHALAALGPTAVFGLTGDGPSPRSDLVDWRASTVAGAADTSSGEALVEALRVGRSPFVIVDSPAAAVELLEVVDAVDPDLVVVCGFEMTGYLTVLRPRAPRLVVDLDYDHAVAAHDLAATDPNRRRSLLWRHVAKLVAEEERAAVGVADQAWVSTAAEADRMRASGLGEGAVAVVPNAVDVTSYPTARRASPHLVFLARYDYWPNEVAARTLTDDILPALPDFTLSLVGAAPAPWMRALHDDRVTVTGAVPDIRPFLADGWAMPVPLTAGAGTRFKILEAFASRLPVVSTAKGVEGLDVEPSRHYVGAESGDEFVTALTRLRDDPAKAERVMAEAAQLVDARYSSTAVEAAVSDAVAAFD